MANPFLSDLGYLAIAPETTAGTINAVPSISTLLYKEAIKTNINNNPVAPIIGQKYAKFMMLPGQRSYGGTVEVMAEPNTVGFFFNMLLNKTGTSGANPYTHTLALNSTAPKSYTVDIAKGNNVFRLLGVQASEIKEVFTNNEMRLQVKLHALKSFTERGIATISTVTLTLDTKFTPTPTAGLIVGDLITIYKKGDPTTKLDTTVASITDGVTVVLADSAASFAAGDLLTLKKQSTPATNVLTPFLWSSTEFRFADTAANALTAAATPLEEGSEWTITHKMHKDTGELRSGSQDPIEFARLLGDVDIKLKKLFTALDDQAKFQNIEGQALVVRHFAGATNQYELRLTFNDIRIMDGAEPGLAIAELLYSDMKVAPVYKAADGQAFDVKVINAISTL